MNNGADLTPTARPLNPFQVILMAIAAGVSVANIYYNQPILKQIAKDLNVSEVSVGYTSMSAQIGYGIGLFFIIPLGDKVNLKKLVLLLLILLVLSPCFLPPI